MTAASGALPVERQGRLRRTAAPFLLPTSFAIAVAVLLAAGRGPLAAPPLENLAGWAGERGPLVASVALLRLAALGGAAWMLVLTLVGTAAGALGATGVAGAAERALPPVLRRILTGVAGAGAAGVIVLGAPGAPTTGSAAAPPAVERLVRLPDLPAEPPPVETMTVLDGADGTAPVAPAPAPPTAPVAPAGPASVGPGAAGETWVVQPGESFWSIAEEVVGERLGRAPTDGEIVPCWRRLVEANRDRLVTGDADLLFPGQELVLPSPDA